VCNASERERRDRRRDRRRIKVEVSFRKSSLCKGLQKRTCCLQFIAGILALS
jgi:hypothetical protein